MLSTCCWEGSDEQKCSEPATQTYSEVLEVIDGDFVAEQVQKSVLQHASVAVAVSPCQILGYTQHMPRPACSREDEAIAVDPIRVLGVEVHELVEEDVGNRCHAHWSTRMPRVGRERGIDGQRPDGVDA